MEPNRMKMEISLLHKLSLFYLLTSLLRVLPCRGLFPSGDAKLFAIYFRVQQHLVSPSMRELFPHIASEIRFSGKGIAI